MSVTNFGVWVCVGEGCVWLNAVLYKTVMDSLSVGRKEASKTQTAMNEVKKKPLEMLVIEWLNIKQGWMGL